MSTPATDLAQRYRGPSRGTRLVVLLVVAVLAVSGVGLVGWAFIDYGKPEVTSKLTSFRLLDDHAVRATFTLTRRSPATEATCRFTALAEDHAVVGESTVRVADGPATQSLALEIRTERRATSVDLEGCTAPGQARPR